MAEPRSPRARGLILAAPASGSGKTVLTMALLRRLKAAGNRVGAIKTGPDYIDPAFHAAACGEPCLNLDLWAMRRGTVAALVERISAEHELVIAEGAMGLFDGAADGSGATADLAALTGWPVVLVVDARGQGASIAALVRGFRDHRRDVDVAGVICNRVGSADHAAILAQALEPIGLPLLGLVHRDESLALPGRHLGLVQAAEHGDLERFIAEAAERVGRQLDLTALTGLMRPARDLTTLADPANGIPPLGQRIAVARDEAFAFAYPALLRDWRERGAALSFFSPLADEGPDPAADAVYLPGGYPELHAGRLAHNERLMTGLRVAAQRGAAIYGECGGYMLLGQGLVDAEGQRQRMTELLPLETSFAERKLHLGYRAVTLRGEVPPLGAAGSGFRGHEFHYARILSEAGAEPLFASSDARHRDLGAAGQRVGRVFGSFVHLIDRAA
ncbi:cobyrinic acid a,c-diamide synthase [Hypericibacter adhaerens]|uniref:Cobyrinate a,c-diamide synthase n=1 Tax=Hypericibacter adhaerens TaxID=2602016 RepID=A0A5J6N2C7_9PROT|nr:cobyrinate a,c-diamide synthase [Hypericibacter adhaerens]QEX23859.1 cobyrinic acid a,c-diamide synthase [Hypericibacter adhaerens]